MTRTTEYASLWGIQNKQTGDLVLTYWASSQPHKALFVTKKTATTALKWFSDGYEVVEFKLNTKSNDKNRD